MDSKSFGCGLVVGASLTLFVSVALVLIAATVMQKRESAASVTGKDSASFSCPVVGDETIAAVLKPVRQKFDVPAMAACLVTSSGIKFVGAIGIRKRDTETPVTLDELW